MEPEVFAKTVFKGLVKDRHEIVVGLSKLAQLLSRLAPGVGFKKLNTDEEKQNKKLAVKNR